MKALRELAHFKGILNVYISMDKKRKQVPDQTLIALLKVLGLPIENNGQNAEDLLLQEKFKYWGRPLEPVALAWDGKPDIIKLRIPAGENLDTLRVQLILEDGSSRELKVKELKRQFACYIQGHSYDVACLTLAETELPLGYHKLHLTWGSESHKAHVIAAPRESYQFSGSQKLGVFSPVYALKSERNWGAGDLTDFEDLMKWTQDRGGQLLGTLPLLSQFLGRPFLEASPYAPASRLFWNEFFLDVEKLPEFQTSARARKLVDSPEFQNAVARQKQQGHVDYEALAGLKREVLEILVEELWISKTPRQNEMMAFLESHPDVDDYARFRARCDHEGSWHVWDPKATGKLELRTNEEPNYRYYAYTQWLMHLEMTELNRMAHQKGPGLYLDLPLGVHSDSYDTWKFRSQFIGRCSAGAPPDPFFQAGQNWGFNPLHPQTQRESGYEYFRKFLTHHMRYCGILRIDHVMGLNRLYCIPEGVAVRDGAYLRYQVKELLAIICLESHRTKTAIIGEDLGTVPTGVRMAMDRHKLSRMFIAPFEWNLNDPKTHMNPIPAGSLTAMNTHDMPPFAGFLEGQDIGFQHKLGLLKTEHANQLKDERKDFCRNLARSFGVQNPENVADSEIEQMLRETYDHMASSCSPLFLLNIEDFWLERSPQNVPGTWREWPNWKQKLKFSLEEIKADPKIRGWIEHLSDLRRSDKQC